MARRLTVIDRRSSDVIAFPRTRIEEAGMDLTAFGMETKRTVEQVWRAAAMGDFAAMAQHLTRLEAKAAAMVDLGQSISGDVARAPSLCPDQVARPGHGEAA